MDAGNLSKAERGLLPPPDEPTIDEMADALGLSEDEGQRLKDLAVAERMSPVAGGYVKDRGVLIPMLLRTVERKRLTREELMRLIESINDNY
jgi:hypothetical protein